MCLDGARRNNDDTGPDISRVDYTWCLIALDWGFELDEVTERLRRESGKAREAGQGERYAKLTAASAAAAIKRRAGSRPGPAG